MVTQPLIEGGCDCGAVRYRLAGPPMFVHCCHCTVCQRHSGTAFAMNAVIESDRVRRLQGELRRHPADKTANDGETVVVVRCAACSGLLWSHHPGYGETVALIYAGTLDRAADFPPGAHCFLRSKHPWVGIPDDVPAADEFYDMDACWPESSKRRLDAALAGSERKPWVPKGMKP
ncbi:hypothetical protein A7J71_16910 [Achromobacter insolitus]|nr:hypothetical protein A7J71_16910 [Achromobacter insolitus]OCZ51277.1 hypothetical protein A7P22_19830 [Achromobacter insolitus]